MYNLFELLFLFFQIYLIIFFSGLLSFFLPYYFVQVASYAFVVEPRVC